MQNVFHHPLYRSWRGMRERCNDPEDKSYADYGARGIAVCERWELSFRNFLEDMGERPEGCSLDRIDNDKGYSPENCRWATRTVQNRNRPRRPARTVIIEGQTYYPGDLASQSGLHRASIIARAARGLSLAEVVSPVRVRSMVGPKAGGAAFAAKRMADKTCRAGHLWADNAVTYGKDSRRHCRTCTQERHARKKAREAG